MKIIHCADLHLDSRMTANLTKEQARERKREIIRTFTRMVEYAEKTGVRLIMISGDLFDTRNVSALARNTVRDMICTHPQIDFLYLRGNHDSDNFLSELEEVPDGDPFDPAQGLQLALEIAELHGGTMTRSAGVLETEAFIPKRPSRGCGRLESPTLWQDNGIDPALIALSDLLPEEQFLRG